MARVNVEDSLFKENGFLKLVIRTGSPDTALGAMVRAWIVAQQYWVNGEKPIPREIWDREELNPAILECGMAREDGGGIYVRGAKEQFAWLVQRVDAGKSGGKKSGEARRKTIKEKPKRNEAKRSGVKRGEPSSSSSFSDSLSSSSSDKYLYSVGEAPPGAPEQEEIRSPIGFFIANYVNAYRLRYGETARPDLSGKVQGQIKRFVQETPIERACQLIQTYCQMNDSWFITKAHDFGTFIENLGKVGLKLDTGRAITRTEARGAETADFHKSQMERILRGDL